MTLNRISFTEWIAFKVDVYIRPDGRKVKKKVQEIYQKCGDCHPLYCNLSLPTSFLETRHELPSALAS
jgi:hypothetical protein